MTSTSGVVNSTNSSPHSAGSPAAGAGVGLLERGHSDPAGRFTESALRRDSPSLPAGQVLDWLASRLGDNRFEVTRIPFAAMAQWGFQAGTGNLVHASGRFFSVEGLRVATDYGPVDSWSQPIVNQPEVGILGIIVKEFDGVLHCLMSAKMEPGNVNTLQLSPTVQATRSNYTRAHQGGATAYLEHFVGSTRSRVLVDVLQSEQGSWFHRKCNRNMVVEVLDDIPVGPDFCWLTIGQVLALMHVDNIVNMDARTVLACMPFDAPPATGAGTDPWTEALHRSLAGDHALHSLAELLSWFTEAKTRYFLHADRVPLKELRGWRQTDREIVHEEGKYFKVIAASVAASNREVARWSQPLIEPLEHGVVALLVKRIHGVLHALIHVRVEAGYLDTLELAPTVQCSVGNYDDVAESARPPFLRDALHARPDQLRYDALLSEEGGRFYHAQNRYRIIEVDGTFPTEAGPDFRWMTLDQLRELLLHSHYLNVQARSLVASLHALWAGAV